MGNRGRLNPFAGQCQESPARGTDTRYGERLGGAGEFFGYPNALDVAPDGQLYVSRSSLGDIVRVSPAGSIEHVAGSSSRVNPGGPFSASRVVDGSDARTLNNGFSGSFIDLVVGADSSVYVLRSAYSQADRIDADLRIWRYASDLSFSRSLELRATDQTDPKKHLRVKHHC